MAKKDLASSSVISPDQPPNSGDGEESTRPPRNASVPCFSSGVPERLNDFIAVAWTLIGPALAPDTSGFGSAKAAPEHAQSSAHKSATCSNRSKCKPVSMHAAVARLPAADFLDLRLLLEQF